MDPIKQFEREKENRIKTQGENISLIDAARSFREESIKSLYSYNFSWMGRPIIQYPQDIIAMQEILWKVKPDLLIETGIAHGGSIIFYASILQLIGKGEVLGIDIEIRPHNRKAIEDHPMARRITMIEGDSTFSGVLDKVEEIVKEKKSIMVCLDSNHSHDHVLNELKLYSPFVTKGSYLIVFDTIIEELPNEFYPHRPWSKDYNPKTAVRDFLKVNDRFTIDKSIEKKLLITVAPDGYLKCIKE